MIADLRNPANCLWIGFLVTCVVACGAPVSAEQEIREWLAAAEVEAEARDRRALLSRVAEGYKDGRGNDREAIGGMLRYYFLRQRNVVLLTRIEEIELYGESAARVTLTAAMGGSNDGGLSADARRFVLDLERRSSDWMLTDARWGHLGDEPK